MGAADRRTEIFTKHAPFFLTLFLGTAMTIWNAYNAVHYVLSESVSDLYERQGVVIFTPRFLQNTIKQVASEVTPTYHLDQESSLAVIAESKKADNRLGGRAHLGHQYFLFSSPGTKNLMRWNLDRRLGSYIEGGVAYNGGCLSAEESGYYFVYSQVSFVKAIRDWAADQSTVTHELIRLTNATHEMHTLLRVQKTHRWDTQLRCSLDASYLGGTFFLQKGDKIFVAVSDANFIWQSPRRTYFGMRSI